VKIGVLLPSFDSTADRSLEAARAAEQAGIHGVFAYDHLWQPDTDRNPSIMPFPLLGAIAGITSRLSLGTLVVRVALSLDEIVVHSFMSLDRLSGGRVIAGIGTGDAKSAAEHVAFGLPYEPAATRRLALARCASALVAEGLETWIGGGGDATNAVAGELGATVNLWSATPERVAVVAESSSVTWGGVLKEGIDGGALLRALEVAGASWAVFTWGHGLEPLLEAARAAGIALDT
jgi:alkanesulfonate monooxygenase SsuD/methylene tetrahydromethanopterin reductase-like flavin-dependent oxidoreductase (luciferase family)